MILAKVPKIEYWQMGVYLKENGCLKRHMYVINSLLP